MQRYFVQKKGFMRMLILLFLMMGVHMQAQQKGGGDNSFLITEVCVANIDQTIDYSYNYGGWVELYNPTATAVSLNGWHISDDIMNLF